MDGSKPGARAAGASKPERRNPRTIRFLDPEWQRIEAFANERGLTGPEFVRFAVLAAIVDGPAGGGAADRLAPLIERTFRYSYTMATKLREDMLAEGRDGELEELVRAARAVQDELLGGSKAE